MNDVFELLARVMHDRRFDLLLIGGYALQAYGSARQTLDADVLVSDGDQQILNEALTEAGYRRIARTKNFARFRHSEAIMQDVDVLFLDPVTLGKLISESRTMRMGHAEIRVPSLQHLVALKLHAMKNNPSRKQRDLADIVDLLRINPGSVPPEDLQKLCEKFGPRGILGEITRASHG